MKKLSIYAAIAGLTAVVICWLHQKEKSDNNTLDSSDNIVTYRKNFRDDEFTQSENVVKEMHQAKEESAQAISDRHTQAGKIMKDAYRNIMEDFVEDLSTDEDVNGKRKEVIIDNDDVSAIKELDSISDELDNLLK